MHRVAQELGAYKAYVRTALDLSAGLTVVDLGCGPGTDLIAMAEGVGSNGRVIGVDFDERMVLVARDAVADRQNIEVLHAAAQQLPFVAGSLDRVRTDRALQHMSEPEQVLAEIARVLVPGGLLVVAEPDWSALQIDGGDPATSEAFVRFTCERIVRNATIGRDISELAATLGFELESQRVFVEPIDDFDFADYVVGLTRNSRSAVRAGYLTDVERDSWLARLHDNAMSVSLTQVVTALRRTA